MNALLVRVGADQSVGGGRWNGPIDAQTRKFVYVAIPEANAVHPGYEKPYSALMSALEELGMTLPNQLGARHMHLDPDFERLTYGDQGERAKQLRANLGRGDMIVFYAGLADRHGSGLVYALIGILIVADLVPAREIAEQDRDLNAHSRRVLKVGAEDLIVIGQPGVSGRFRYCLPIGDYRDRAYRVRPELLDTWGGLSVRDGYLQRSARLPKFTDPARFMGWLAAQQPELLQANN